MIVMLHPTNQRAQKQLRNFKAVDGSPLDRTVYLSVVRFAAQELERLGPHRQNLTAVFMNCQNGRFVQNDALLWREDDRIDCAQIDCQIIGEKAAEDIHKTRTSLLKIAGITATYMPSADMVIGSQLIP